MYAKVRSLFLIKVSEFRKGFLARMKDSMPLIGKDDEEAAADSDDKAQDKAP